MKIFKIAAAVLGMTILLSGCGLSTKAAMNESNEPIKVTATSGKEIPQQTQGTESQTAGEQENTQKRGKPDFAGTISEMVGNEVTLNLVKMPEMAETPQRNRSGQGTSKQDGTSQDSSSAEKKTPKAITGSTDSGFPGGPGGPGFPGGGSSKGQSSQKSGSTSTAASSQKKLDLEYTGEEKTITLPVGMSITSGRGQQGGTFETLQKGNVISVWLDEAGNVERVSLISGGTQ